MDEDEFKSSNGYIARFKARHAIESKLILGEGASAPESTVNEWVETILPSIIKGYQPRDIYNVDETGLLYQMMPHRTLAFKRDSCQGGKPLKSRITVLLGSNITVLTSWNPLIL